ncbi:protein NPGR1 [Cryptomeria japonica]|uniref:protein NPGR1 n=1 Tax=Cryptomeria japonica TaxID=3369 RepID=UPI0027DA34ED|nr:protein NPGR1 [Cryptomeria japonica]XP_057862241.2 protein NPGR1 [Cryptomeria japonica]
MMLCNCSREQFKFEEMSQSPESLATRDFSASAISSSRTGDADFRFDEGGIEEAESSLREALSLNYEEARALLGRLEYQRGNVEAALQVFEGIDMNRITSKMRQAISERVQSRKIRSRNGSNHTMSMHAVSLLLESILLKAKSLQELGLAKEAAQECKIILETVEPALPYGLPEASEVDLKVKENVSKAAELLPELWKQAGMFHEAIAAYRRALFNPWCLDSERSARIQKEFAIFLLYGGIEAGPPSLGLQVEGALVPRNNIEEAILLLLILLKKFVLKKIAWDETIMDHLSFALSISGQFETLADKIEEVLPGIYNRSDRWYTLSLCYSAAGRYETALNLLRKCLGPSEKPDYYPALLLAAKLCGKSSQYACEGVNFARRALESTDYENRHMKGVANHLLGIALGKQARSVVYDSERAQIQREALTTLEKAATIETRDPEIMFNLGLENAGQRNLDVALRCTKKFLDMVAGASVKGWRLLTLVLSAQKRLSDAVLIIDAALDETGKWERGELLHSKAKLQIAKGQTMHAIETYKQLLALVQAQRKTLRAGNWKHKGGDNRAVELEAWQELAYVYTSLGQWSDGDLCLDRATGIKLHSSINWHARGKLYEAQGLYKEALIAFSKSLAVEPDHVPSLISTAAVLRELGEKSLPVARSFLADALRLDPTNHIAWFNLGMVHKMEGSKQQAADCFQAACVLEQSAPVEKF